MKIFIQSLDRGVWNAIVNEPYMPKTIINGETVDKPCSEWNDIESKKAKFDCMTKKYNNFNFEFG